MEEPNWIKGVKLNWEKMKTKIKVLCQRIRNNMYYLCKWARKEFSVKVCISLSNSSDNKLFTMTCKKIKVLGFIHGRRAYCFFHLIAI
jgi:hypothetical protein